MATERKGHRQFFSMAVLGSTYYTDSFLQPRNKNQDPNCYQRDLHADCVTSVHLPMVCFRAWESQVFAPRLDEGIVCMYHRLSNASWRTKSVNKSKYHSIWKRNCGDLQTTSNTNHCLHSFVNKMQLQSCSTTWSEKESNPCGITIAIAKLARHVNATPYVASGWEPPTTPQPSFLYQLVASNANLLFKLFGLWWHSRLTKNP